MSEVRIDGKVPGVEKMREGLTEFLSSLADEGDIVAPVNAVLLYECQGIEPDGRQFGQASYVAITTNGQRTSVLGLLDIVVPELRHDLTCKGQGGE